MSIKQTTQGYIGSETPDTGRWTATAGIGPVPNFNRESGNEQTELGAPVSDLCERARGNL